MKLDEYYEIYMKKTSTSKKYYEKARKIFPGGINHNIRFFYPYPFFTKEAKANKIIDLDNNTYTDYWMGHWALILGHSPSYLVNSLTKQIRKGTLYGTVNDVSIDLANIIKKLMPNAENIRFSSTGSEATMYAVRLARARTGKKIVGKIIGGWHGFNSSLLESVNYPFEEKEGTGLDINDKYIVSIPFNDLTKSIKILNSVKNDLACIIVEPILAGAGCIPPNEDYLIGLQEFSKKNNIIFILDEIVTGFRLSINGAQKIFKLEPDLFTLGKIAGGGLPIGILCGNKEIMSLANPINKPKNSYCAIGGGTFSTNPLSMISGIHTLKYLKENNNSVYKKIDNLGKYVRKELYKLFSENKINVKITGMHSMFHIHFLNNNIKQIKNATDVALCNKKLLFKYHFSLIALKNIFFLPYKMGAISYTHSKKDIDYLLRSTNYVIDSGIMKE